MRELSDYEIFSEAMFAFVNNWYGVDQVIKRYYIKGNYTYSSTLECRFKVVPVFLVRSDVLRAGKQPAFEAKQYVAISKKMGYKDLRKRLSDVLCAKYADL